MKWGLAALLYGALLSGASTPAVAAAGEGGGFVALILPGKSPPLKPAADAIKAGVMAAARVHGSVESLPVRLFETGEAEEESLAMFNLAKSQGARAVIGPLTRSAMNYLSDTADFSIPVLALNSFDEGTLRRPGLYSFGLSIEAEVAQVVRAMRAAQVRAPLVVLAEGPLSARMAHAFAEHWGAAPARLEIDEALPAAEAVLAKLVGVDAVFFAANGRRAAQIRPLLPGDVPCYATSQITVGRTVPASLAGVHYLETPWLAEPDNPAFLRYGRRRSPSGDVERLFALGVDAWQLAEALARGRPPVVLDGLSGQLRLGADGVVVREWLARTAGSRTVAASPPRAPDGMAAR